MTPDTRVTSVGRFPSRGEGTRLAVTGFLQPCDVIGFLERTGWAGERSGVEEVMSRLKDDDAFAYMALHFHIGVDGVAPALGLSFFARKRPWTQGIACWAPLLDNLCKSGLVNSKKLSALSDSLSGSKLMLGRSGAFAFYNGIHHIKLVLKESQVEQVKAYCFFIVVPQP